MNIKNYMCNKVFTVNTETNVHEISKIMHEKRIGCVLVCNSKNKLAGIITDRDIVLRGVVCKKELEKMQAQDIMSSNICFCNEHDDLAMAKNMMIQNQIRRIPVCNNDKKVVGIITFGDIAKNAKQLNNYEVTNTAEGICCDSENSKNNN